MRNKIIILVEIFSIITSNFAAFMRNKYVMDVEAVKPCPENDDVDAPIRNLKYLHLNRTHKSLSFSMTYPYPLDEKVGAALLLYRWGDGGWINMPFLPFQRDVCNTYLKYFKQIWINFETALGVKQPDKCPIPAGNYAINNYVIDIASITQIPFWSGRFKFTTYAYREGNKRNMTCISFFTKSTEVF